MDKELEIFVKIKKKNIGVGGGQVEIAEMSQLQMNCGVKISKEHCMGGRVRADVNEELKIFVKINKNIRGGGLVGSKVGGNW